MTLQGQVTAHLLYMIAEKFSIGYGERTLNQWMIKNPFSNGNEGTLIGKVWMSG